MKVPVSIPVGGYQIEVVYEDAVKDTDAGDLHGTYFEHKITISKAKNSTPSKVFATLYHEAVHAALDVCGLSELLGEKREEAVVSAIESMLAPIVVITGPNVKWANVKFPWEKK